MLVDKVGTCIIAGKKTKLPSVAQAQIWTSFHKRRNVSCHSSFSSCALLVSKSYFPPSIRIK